MKWTRLLLWFVVLLLVLMLILPLAAGNTVLGAMLIHLPFGWLHFLTRNIPQLRYDWGLITTGVICTTLMLALGHWFMNVVCQHMRTQSADGNRACKWRWRWSVSLYATVWILFAVAFGAAGVWRHATWLANYQGPWYEERRYVHSELMRADLYVEMRLRENERDLEKTRMALLAERGDRRNWGLLSEQFDILLYGGSNNLVAAHLIIPREPRLFAQGMFAVCVSGDRELIKPLADLPSTLSEMEAKYSSKDPP